MSLHEGTWPFTTEVHYLLREPTGGAGPAPLVLALHGQGMDGTLFEHLLRPLPDAMRLLVPDGPYPFEKRSPEGIQVGYGWYIYRGDQREFREHLERSEAFLLGLLDDVTSRTPIDRDRAVVLGYSQGGYLAGFLALRHPDRFRGLVLASTRLKHEFLENELKAGHLPTTLCVHGENDPALSWERARESVAALSRAGGKVDSFLHREGHRLPPAAVEAVADWLRRNGFVEREKSE